MDLYHQRYSVRKFKSDPISKETLLSLIESARVAPSACNKQPWKFIVVNDVNLKNEIVEKSLSGVHSFNQFVKQAPVVIAVLAEKDFITNKLAAQIQGVKYYLLDIGMACQNLVLKAWEQNIGSCYIGWFNERKVKKILKIPRKNKVVMLIALGYFNKEEKEKIRKDVDEIISFNKFY